MGYIACLLLGITVLFLALIFRHRKRNLNSRIALIEAEREVGMRKLKLKEAQATEMQLEKSRALSDLHQVETELIERTADLEQLRKDKEALDEQIELFRQQVEAIETLPDEEKQETKDIQYIIMEDLKDLLSKQISGDSKYIANLEKLNDSFIDTIRKRCQDSLSISYLKYCVCTAIGMGTNEVADCFNIEQSSVHMIRYRLKKKFGLRNDEDLDSFICGF